MNGIQYLVCLFVSTTKKNYKKTLSKKNVKYKQYSSNIR